MACAICVFGLIVVAGMGFTGRTEFERAAVAPTVEIAAEELKNYAAEMETAVKNPEAVALLEKSSFKLEEQRAYLKELDGVLERARSADLHTQTAVLADFNQRIIPSMTCYRTPLCADVALKIGVATLVSGLLTVMFFTFSNKIADRKA
jgi:hypothetical protein